MASSRIGVLEFVNDNQSTVNLKCIIKNFKLNALVDSSAGCSVISKATLNKICPQNDITKTDKILVEASGHNMDVMGLITLPVKVVGTRREKSVVFT